jgi:hypothetical protein
MIADMLTLVGAYSPLKKPRRRSPGEPLGHPFLDSLRAHEAEAVCQAEEEYLRRMHFKRVFPTAAAHDVYRPLFREVRALNELLCQWEKAKAESPFHPPVPKQRRRSSIASSAVREDEDND